MTHAVDGRGPQRLLANTAASFAAKAIDVGATVLVVAAASRYLGPERYGQYAFLLSLASFLAAFTYFGLERVAVREMAADLSASDRTLGLTLSARWILSAAVATVCIVYAVAADLSAEASWAFGLAAFAQLAQSSSLLYAATFKANERMEYDTLLALSAQILTLLLVGVAVSADLGFVSLFVALAVANAARLAVAVRISSRFTTPAIRFDFRPIVKLLGDAALLGANLLIVQALIRVNVFLLEGMKGPVDVSLYYAPHALLVHLQAAPTAFAVALFPFLSRIASRREREDVLAFAVEKAYKILWALGLGLSGLGLIYAPLVIELVYGGAFADAAPSARLLFASAAFLFVHPLMSFIFVSQGKNALLIPASAAALALNVALAAALIPDHGAFGAAVGSTAGYAILFAVTLAIMLRRVVAAPVIRPTLLSIAIAVMAGGAANLASGVSIHLAAAAWCLLFPAALLLLGFFTREDLALLRKQRDT